MEKKRKFCRIVIDISNENIFRFNAKVALGALSQINNVCWWWSDEWITMKSPTDKWINPGQSPTQSPGDIISNFLKLMVLSRREIQNSVAVHVGDKFSSFRGRHGMGLQLLVEISI